MPAAARRSERWAKRLPQLLVLAALVGGVLLVVHAEPRADPVPSEAALVMTADMSLADAMRAGDNSVARRLLSLQFTYADEAGKIHERREFVAALKSFAAAAATDTKAAVYGQIAMVTGHRKSARDSDMFFLDIWAKQKGAWRALTTQDLVPATDEPAAPAAAPGPVAASYECKNPCQAIPYRVRSPAEQDVINAFQTLERAVVNHDADEWGKHIAAEFMRYRSGRAPIAKPGRGAAIEDQKARNIPVRLTAIQSMRLWVYGDGAAMISTNGEPQDAATPTLRIARVWVKRNGQWQMAISAQTAIRAP